MQYRSVPRGPRFAWVLLLFALASVAGCKRKAPVLAPLPENEASPFDQQRRDLDTARVRAAPEAWDELSEVGLGELFACGIADGQVYCWGAGRFGELGIGTSDEPIQRAIPTGPLKNLGHVEQLSANRGFICARERGGLVSCWGNNVHGQLGDGGTSNHYEPVRVQGISDAIWIAAGYQHTCAVHRDGGVSCWGENADGQVGRDGGGMVLKPSRVSGVYGASRVAAGRASSCALFTGGRVECWGSNSFGELGRGVPPEALASAWSPSAVTSIVGAKDLAGYADHFCVVDGDDGVRCWGGKTMPPARVLRTRERRIAANLPVEPLPDIGGVDVIEGAVGAAEVAVGIGYSCMRQHSGHVYCWGENTYAQQGNGSQNFRKDPSPMAAIIGAQRLFAGARTTCVLARDKRMLCSGANRSGEIGNGGTSTALTPTPVLRPQVP